MFCRLLLYITICTLANLKDFQRVEVEYKTFAGWLSDTSMVRKYEDLPDKARQYVEAIEKMIAVPSA